jgi:hypothetical protein
VVDGTVEVVSEGHWKLFTQSGSKRIGLMRHACACAIVREYTPFGLNHRDRAVRKDATDSRPWSELFKRCHRVGQYPTSADAPLTRDAALIRGSGNAWVSCSTP